jgi:malate dehydrogenase
MAQMLGPDQPVILNLIELPGAMNALKGVVMELQAQRTPALLRYAFANTRLVAWLGLAGTALRGTRPVPLRPAQRPGCIRVYTYGPVGV